MAGLNSWSINSRAINSANGGASVVVVGTGSGQLLSIEQTTGLIGSGQLMSFEQTVGLLETGSGLIVSFEQSTTAKGSGALVTIGQNVTTLSTNTFYTRNGYDVEIVIGGYSVPKNQIHGNVEITRVTGESGVCRFTIIPPLGVQDVEVFQGKPVYVNIIKDDISHRQFTGFIDLPSLDIIDKKITFDCTDRRINRINALSRNAIEEIGSYSVHVFGDPTDNNDELSKRLQTVSGDYDFDKEGTPMLTPWTPKLAADFTLTGSDVYYERPRVIYSNRTQTVNTINFTINYNYQRLHQQAINLNWPGYDSLLDWYNNGMPSFPAKDMVESAAREGAWKPITAITHTNLWDAQGIVSGDGGVVIWQPNTVEHEYIVRTKRVGVKVTDPFTSIESIEFIDTPALDVNGKKIYDISKTTITDNSSHLTRGATWRAGLKFAQNVTEQYNITMRSPQAITRYGVIEAKEQIDILDAYDTSVWENTESGVYQVDYNFFINQKPTYPTLGKAFQVMLNKARCDILRAHRDVIVTFTRGIWPNVDLKHTIEINSTPLQCKGKVYMIRHTINASTGEATTDVELRLSRAQGSDTDSTWALIIPPPEDTSYVGSPTNITLGTHLGIDPDPVETPGADEWNGYIGNKNITTIAANNTVLSRTQYVEQFRVDYPAIPEYLRDTRVIDSDYTFNVKVPNDPLTIEF